MTALSEALARLPQYNFSEADVPYTFIGTDGYGYVVNLPLAMKDVVVAVNASVNLAAVGVKWTPETIRARTTANIDLSSGLVNGATHNGLTMATGEFWFVGSQTDASENGIYTVAASGAASRASFADSAAEFASIAFVIQEGAAGTGERWTLAMAEADITVGTTDLNFSQIGIEPDYASEVETARIGEANLTAGIEKAISDATREQLTANRTYYVRTDGSDTNDGLSDNSGGAFLTIQAAVSAAYAVDSNKKDIAIQVRDGTYTAGAAVSGPLPGGGTLTIKGNAGAPENCIVSTTSADAIAATNGAIVTVKDMELRTTTSGNCLTATVGANIQFSNIRFGACAVAHIYALAAEIDAVGNWAVVGSAGYHALAQTRGRVYLSGWTVTLTGTPAFSGSFVLAGAQAIIEAASMTFSGAATGQRHYVAAQAFINTVGGGSSYFPGDSAGAVETANFGLFV